ncbi:TetR/AcrR family transcriptional regulator [Nitratireductor soli]|uniref:TetR/AcrR family transcriptional regulator n=1 Tax=Nitratireductor soli TaxID=1670619 RepID=UPI00065E2AFD|nr:TetR/AcrR family transcriptional regulator [Nitratireductor soli]
MSRKSLFSDDRVFEAVGRLMAEQGALTTTAVQQAVGLSTGSLYHRFGSREGLLAETWLFALRAFQPHFIKALEMPGTAVGEIAAVTPRFCRDHRAEALILACGSRRQFMNEATPVSIVRHIDETNAKTFAAFDAYIRRQGFDPDACRMALIAFPLAAVQQYLPEHEVPLSVDHLVSIAAEAILTHRK